jgi:hypothetical protein
MDRIAKDATFVGPVVTPNVMGVGRLTSGPLDRIVGVYDA